MIQTLEEEVQSFSNVEREAWITCLGRIRRIYPAPWNNGDQVSSIVLATLVAWPSLIVMHRVSIQKRREGKNVGAHWHLQAQMMGGGESLPQGLVKVGAWLIYGYSLLYLAILIQWHSGRNYTSEITSKHVYRESYWIGIRMISISGYGTLYLAILSEFCVLPLMVFRGYLCCEFLGCLSLVGTMYLYCTFIT